MQRYVGATWLWHCKVSQLSSSCWWTWKVSLPMASCSGTACPRSQGDRGGCSRLLQGAHSRCRSQQTHGRHLEILRTERSPVSGHLLATTPAEALQSVSAASSRMLQQGVPGDVAVAVILACQATRTPTQNPCGLCTGCCLPRATNLHRQLPIHTHLCSDKLLGIPVPINVCMPR